MKPCVRVAVLVVWALFVTAGGAVLYWYQNQSGQVDESPSTWPQSSKLRLDFERPTLVLFAHPRCPCTRATLEELNVLLARCREKVTAHVLFYQSSSLPTEWSRTDLWRTVEKMGEVELHEDLDGVEAERFGAKTSGHALLFGPDGRLLFSGGITGSRGHSGANAGRLTVQALLGGETAGRDRTPIFGCSLVDRECGCCQ